MPSDWKWKTPENEAREETRLLYEPGNWGDVLKGSWAWLLAGYLSADNDAWDYLDPFAGAPSYPLSALAEERIRSLGGGPYPEAQRTWLAEGRCASTASLVRERALALDSQLRAEVFDADEGRRALWAEVPGVATARDHRTGEELLAPDRLGAHPPRFILVDPYDLFDRWTDFVPHLASLEASSHVLLYLANRSPRGGGHLRNYRSFRRRLEESLAGPILVGRIPADAVLPRLFHEVILLGPALSEERQRELFRITKGLCCRLSTGGSTELVTFQ